MSTPTIYMKNALAIAEQGLGDGTKYASGSSAVPDQANKRFDLTTISIIADLGADGDDKFNGYILYFPASGNKYHIVDWEASTDLATTFEPPRLTDTGPWEIIKTLFVDALNAATPPSFLVDGFPSQRFKKLTNQSLDIKVHLPNFIGDGGFEAKAVGAFSQAEQPKGFWYQDTNNDWAVNGTSPILGSRDAVWTPVVDADLYQRCVGTFKKGKKYRILLKAQTTVGSTSAGALKIGVRNRLTDTHLDADFGTGGFFELGIITTTAAWFNTSTDYVPDFDSEEAVVWLRGIDANKGAASTIIIDEVYIWEVIDVQALAVFNHNWNATPGNLNVWGYRCDPSRTGTSATDFDVLHGSSQVDKSEDFVVDWVTSGIFPIFQIDLQANSSYQYEAGQILLCEKWLWIIAPDRPFDYEEREIDATRSRTKSGITSRSKNFAKRRANGRLSLIPQADVVIWKGSFYECHIENGEVFAATWTGFWDDPILWMNAEESFGLPESTHLLPSTDFHWEEAT